MALKTYNPTSSGQRQRISIDYRGLTKKAPEKRLLESFKDRAGRSGSGRISVRHQGGGHKKMYRIIDWKMDKFNIPAKVASLEYDPNRTAFIALLHYSDGEKRYILAPDKLEVGSVIISAEKAPLKLGNRMQLKNIPVGTQIYNVSLYPNEGGQIARSAGSYLEVQAIDGDYALLKMSSDEIRKVKSSCTASIGQVSNPDHFNVVLGKAGRARWMGRRPHVRGTAMNPVDHPHGGGEGCQPIGLRLGPKTPWGKQAFGVRTRKKNRWSSRFIMQRRKK